MRERGRGERRKYGKKEREQQGRKERGKEGGRLTTLGENPHLLSFDAPGPLAK